MFIINAELASRVKNENKKCIKLKTISETTMKKVLEKLFKEFHDFKIAFDRIKVEEFPLHRFYDYKIELKDEKFQIFKS